MQFNVRLVLILFLALSLRLVSIDQSLWLDEAIQAWAAINHSLFGLFSQYLPADFNPPLSYLVSWFGVRLLGQSEIWLRLPSVIFGTATIGMAYFLVREFFPKVKVSVFGQWWGAAELTALFLATAPLLIYYSQEARPYALACFLALWSMWELKHFLDSKDRVTVWRLVLATGLMLYSHYLTWFLLPAQTLIVLATQDKKKLRLFVLSLALEALLILPWLPLLLKQLNLGQVVNQDLAVWRQLGTFSLKNVGLVPVKFLLGRISLANKLLYALMVIPLLLLVAAVFLKAVQRTVLFFWLWLVIPLSLGAALSLKLPIFQYFRFLFVLPAFYLLLVWGITRFKSPWQSRLVVFFLVLNFLASGTYLLNPNFHREDWRRAVSFIEMAEKKPTVVILRPVTAPFWYYDRSQAKLVDYSEIQSVRFEKNLWLIKYAQPIFEPANITELKLRQYGFEEASIKDFNGVTVKYLVNPTGLTAEGVLLP